MTHMIHSTRTTAAALAVLSAASLTALAGDPPWVRGGNTAPGDFRLGLTDNNSLLLISNSIIGLQVQYRSAPSEPPFFPATGINLIGGYTQSHLINASAVAVTIFGGANLSGTDFGNTASDNGCTISGGWGNEVGNANGTYDDAEGATVAGGTFNKAIEIGSVVAGGSNNTASGLYSMVLGGYGNRAGGAGSFAGGGGVGSGSYVRNAAESGDFNGDEGTFAWSDATASMVSTGPNQFLVQASGGMGLNTNAPRGAMEIFYNSNSSRPQLTLTEDGADYARINFRNNTTTRFFSLASFSAGATQALDRLNFYHNLGGNLISCTGDGKVGIGTASPGAFRLAVNGDAGKPGGGSWAVFSDSRLKDNIAPLSGTLDRLMQLRGYSFDYKPEAIEHNLALPGTQVGLLAEEVEKVFPQWVQKDDAGYRFVTERSTTALMVEGLRDLRAEKDSQLAAQQRSLDLLAQENALLKARLEKLETLLK